MLYSHSRCMWRLCQTKQRSVLIFFYTLIISFYFSSLLCTVCSWGIGYWEYFCRFVWRVGTVPWWRELALSFSLSLAHTGKSTIGSESLIWVPGEHGCFWAEQTCSASVSQWENEHLVMKLKCVRVCIDTHRSKDLPFPFPQNSLPHTLSFPLQLVTLQLPPPQNTHA